MDPPNQNLNLLCDEGYYLAKSTCVTGLGSHTVAEGVYYLTAPECPLGQAKE